MAEDLGTLVAKLGADLTDLKKGLLEGRQQFQSFQGLIESGAAQVRSVLQFAGLSLGLYEVISQLKAFGSEILDIGSKSELLKASAYAIGQHYQVSGGSIDYYVQQLRAAGLEQEKALYAINAFLKAGLSMDLLPQVLQAAKNLAPTMAQPFDEAFQTIVQNVVKGTPKALAEMAPGIKQALQAATSETKKLLDSTIVSGAERAQIMLDFVLLASSRADAVGAATADSYTNKLIEYRKAAKEAKEALFELLQPMAMAVTGEKIQAWEDLYVWVSRNRQALHDAGEAVSIWVERLSNTIRNVIEFTVAHKELIKTLLELAVLGKVASWIVGIGVALTTVIPKLVAAAGMVAGLQVACSGPFAIVITVALGALFYGINKIRELQNEVERVNRIAASKGRGPLTVPGEGVKLPEVPGIGPRGQITPELLAQLETEGRGLKAKREAEVAAAQGRSEGALGAGAKKGGGGKGGGGAAEDVFADYLKLKEQERQADLQGAQSSLEILKANNALKKAELEKALAEGLMDGQTYYARLQELEATEVQAALKAIDLKKEAAAAARRDALQDLERQDLSEEDAAHRRQTIEAKYRMETAQLNAEGIKAKLDGEVKVTNELKRQVEVQKEYKRKTEDLALESAWGPIAEQEAKLQKMYLDWQRAKEEAIKAGAYTPEYAAALDRKLQTDLGKAQYGDLINRAVDGIMQGMNGLVDSVMDGGKNFQAAVNNFFKSLLKEAFKPGLDWLAKQLKQLLTDLFQSLAGGGSGGSLFGGVGLFGGLFGGGAGEADMFASLPGTMGLADLPIPFLAEGALVNRPTLAMVGESGPELIAPLNRLGELLAGAGGTQVYFHINALDGDSFRTLIENRSDLFLRMAEENGNAYKPGSRGRTRR